MWEKKTTTNQPTKKQTKTSWTEGMENPGSTWPCETTEQRSHELTETEGPVIGPLRSVSGPFVNVIYLPVYHSCET